MDLGRTWKDAGGDPASATSSTRLECHMLSRARARSYADWLVDPVRKSREEKSDRLYMHVHGTVLDEAGVRHELLGGTRHALFVAVVLNETRHNANEISESREPPH